MILILSEAADQSTNDVIDWLDHYGEVCVRVNGTSLDDGSTLTLDLERGRVAVGGVALDDTRRAINAIWARRWRGVAHDPTPSVATTLAADQDAFDLVINLSLFRRAELRALTAYIFTLADACPRLGHPARMSVNKLVVLAHAKACGLRIPETLVTTSRMDAEAFAASHLAVITKPIAEVLQLPASNSVYMTYTTRLTAADVAHLPARFFPALFQAEVPKACELRVFFLAGQCFTMAMFSQARAETGLDFRRYNAKDPTRCVPYELPAEIESRICALMAALDLDTGSLDLIVTPDDEHVFLEVNPVGQFGMTSEPCNYHLERRIADYLYDIAAGRSSSAVA